MVTNHFKPIPTFFRLSTKYFLLVIYILRECLSLHSILWAIPNFLIKITVLLRYCVTFLNNKSQKNLREDVSSPCSQSAIKVCLDHWYSLQQISRVHLQQRLGGYPNERNSMNSSKAVVKQRNFEVSYSTYANSE